MNLFVTDYDGTLYIDENDIKKTNKMLSKLKEKGFKIMISTGRSYPSIKNQVLLHHIPYDYLSCADGSIIYNDKDEIMQLFYMDQKIVKPYQEFYSKLNYEEIQYVYPEGYSNIFNANNTQLLGINICLSTINYNEKIVNAFNLMSKDYPEYNFLNYMHPNYSYLCIKSKGITKSSTIKYIMKKEKIPRKNIYVIGDSDNDYEMIKDYHGVCMDTSCIEVLNISKNKYKSVRNYIIDILKKI